MTIIWRVWTPSRGSFLLQRKVQIEGQTDLVDRLIRPLAAIVLVLVIDVEFDVLPYGKQAARKERGGAPLLILARVVRFGRDIRDQVVGIDGKGPLQLQSIPISPIELAAFPVEIGAVAVRKVKAGTQGKVEGRHRLHAIVYRRIRRDDVTVSGLQNQEPRFLIVQVKGCYLFQFYQGLQIELETGTDRELIRRAPIAIVLGLEVRSKNRIQPEISVHFRQKLRVLRARRQAPEKKQQRASRKCFDSSLHQSYQQSAD